MTVTIDVLQEADIIVYGTPAPQGSKRAIINQYTGKAAMTESSKRLKPWREAVKEAALAATQIHGRTPGGEDTLTFPGPLDGPLLVTMVFSFARPKGHYRTGRNAHLLRDGAPPRPSGIPDLSKLLRSTEDALSDAGIWTDDARVVEYWRAAKVWVGEDVDALWRPGALIRIRKLTDVRRGRP